MTSGNADIALDERDRIIRAAVRLLIESGTTGLTAQAICAAAGVDQARYDQEFTSVESVYTAVVATLLDDHVANDDGAVALGRSLEESLRVAMRAVWDLVESRIDVHHALYVMTVSQAGDPQLVQDMGFSVHDMHLRVAESWLRAVEATYDVTWQLRVGQLALLMQAMLDGLVLDYLSRRNSAEIHQVLDIFADQLAQHARPSTG